MDMLRRGWKMGLYAKYVITDSWFTCEQLMACVRSIGKGAMHFVGLAKMGKTKYTVSGRKKNAAELIATYERERGKNCRKYKMSIYSAQRTLRRYTCKNLPHQVW